MDLRTWRRANNVSVAEIARACRISESSLFHYETGRRRPRPEIAERIASFTRGQVSAGELLGLTDRGAGLTSSNRREAVVSVQLPRAMALEADRLGLDTAALVAEGGIEGLKAALRRGWADENAKALEKNREHIERHGTFGERVCRALKQ